MVTIPDAWQHLMDVGRKKLRGRRKAESSRLRVTLTVLNQRPGGTSLPHKPCRMVHSPHRAWMSSAESPGTRRVQCRESPVPAQGQPSIPLAREHQLACLLACLFFYYITFYILPFSEGSEEFTS